MSSGQRVGGITVLHGGKLAALRQSRWRGDENEHDNKALLSIFRGKFKTPH